MIWRRARVRLAIGLTCIQLVVLVVFSVSVYGYVSSTFDYDNLAPGSSVSSAEAGFAALRTGLLWALIGLTAIAPALYYAVAGLILRPLRRSYDRQREFVDDAAHELRTPLTAIHGQLDLALSRQRGTDELVTFASRALESAERLETTLGDLLAFAAGDLSRIRIVRVDMARSVRDAVVDLDARDRIVVDVADEASWVVGSPDMLRRAVVNLLDNALRYSPGRVRVAVTCVGSSVRVRVEDDGPGMTRSEARRAFVRRWRGSAGGEGSGLGLALVRQTIELHRGSVRIIAHQGVGTTVELTLPSSR